jgi:hypothetical protein
MESSMLEIELSNLSSSKQFNVFDMLSCINLVKNKSNWTDSDKKDWKGKKNTIISPSYQRRYHYFCKHYALLYNVQSAESSSTSSVFQHLPVCL